MNNIKFNKEECDTNLSEITRAESIWGKNFPKDYVEFLLQYNGAIVYPNWPNLGPENNTELWGIERFFSIGDVIIQKLYPMTYTLHDIEEEYFEEFNLKNENLLVFAQGERGIYFFNLAKEEHGQIYIANFSGGDGISKTTANSFNKFINSLGLPDWEEEEIDANFEFSNEYHSGIKVLQRHMFHTPDKPKLGLQRFKDVFEYIGDVIPNEDGYPTIAQKYVNDKLKLDYLIEKGCSTDGLLRYARNAETIRYLVDEKRLDINKLYKGRYPLQNYLTPVSDYDIKVKYELIAELLNMGIEMDWTIKGTQVDGNPDLPMKMKLKELHEKYLNYEIEDKNWWIKNGKPSGHTPFKRSKLIEEKIGLAKTKNWLSRIFKK